MAKGALLLAGYVVACHVAPALYLIPIILAPLVVALRFARRITVWESADASAPSLSWRTTRAALALLLVVVLWASVLVMTLVSQVAGYWLLYPVVTTTIAGPMARDCGSAESLSIQEYSSVTSCIEDALLTGQRFRARVEKSGIDSSLWTAVARGPAGLFVLKFDSSPCGGGICLPSVTSRRCHEPELGEDLECRGSR